MWDLIPRRTNALTLLWPQDVNGRYKNAPTVYLSCREWVFLASDLRAEEFRLSAEVRELDVRGKIVIPALMGSAFRDVSNCGHGRYIKLFGWFLLPALWKNIRVSVVVLEVSDDNEAMIGHKFTHPEADDSVIFSVALRGHLRWAKATQHAWPSAWRAWGR